MSLCRWVYVCLKSWKAALLADFSKSVGIIYKSARHFTLSKWKYVFASLIFGVFLKGVSFLSIFLIQPCNTHLLSPFFSFTVRYWVSTLFLPERKCKVYFHQYLDLLKQNALEVCRWEGYVTAQMLSLGISCWILKQNTWYAVADGRFR